MKVSRVVRLVVIVGVGDLRVSGFGGGDFGAKRRDLGFERDPLRLAGEALLLRILEGLARVPRIGAAIS